MTTLADFCRDYRELESICRTPDLDLRPALANILTDARAGRDVTTAINELYAALDLSSELRGILPVIPGRRTTHGVTLYVCPTADCDRIAERSDGELPHCEVRQQDLTPRRLPL